MGRTPKEVEEARRSAEVFLASTSTKSEIVIYGFRDGFFPFQGELIKETFGISRALRRTSFSPTTTTTGIRTTVSSRN